MIAQLPFRQQMHRKALSSKSEKLRVGGGGWLVITVVFPAQSLASRCNAQFVRSIDGDGQRCNKISLAQPMLQLTGNQIKKRVQSEKDVK